MKKLIIFFGLLLASINSFGFEIYASGASTTNCKGVPDQLKFTAHLERLLRSKGLDAVVINGGVDGDKPIWQNQRLEKAVGQNTKLVIYNAGSNTSSESIKLEFSESALKFLRDQSIPTILVLNSTDEILDSGYEKKNIDLAKQYGAYFYGHHGKNIPMTPQYWQMDAGKTSNTGAYGHLSSSGCQLWAENMAPLVLQVIKEKNIK